MAQTIYLVFDGAYSDHHLCGVYSTLEKAEEAKVIFMADNDIETWVLDSVPAFPPGLLPWYVAIPGEDGESAEASRCSGCNFEEMSGHNEKGSSGYEWDRDYYWFGVLARDEEHAIKIASEKRAQMIAEGK